MIATILCQEFLNLKEVELIIISVDFDHIIEATSYRSDIPIENYFRYDGSYTTPSCAGIIFNQKIILNFF